MTDDRDKAKRAHEDALSKLQEALARTQEVRQVAETTKGWRDRNHFADLLIAAWETRR